MTDQQPDTGFRVFRLFTSIAGASIAFFLLQSGVGLVGGGHGVIWPFLASIIGGGVIILCIYSVARRDFSSLRNWLILAFFLDGLVIWGLVSLGDWWERAGEALIIWASLWFSWQLVFGFCWLMMRKTKQMT